ncbi:MAG: hypothetical protein GF353_21775 [Candidatus Lokiarchaeota archaeon]|nr:hypothetical protein [Candidatus Lokiarchaeota archaeon]
MARTTKSEKKEINNISAEASTSTSPKSGKPKKDSSEIIEPKDVVTAIFNSLREEPLDDADDIRNKIIKRYLKQTIKKHDIANQYNLLILHDEGRMVKNDADNIYAAATKFPEKKPILLILYSDGGIIGSAYLISKLCREYSNGKFVIVVPRRAKSAATLLCCGSDEIHLGSLSELGPIDPQIGNLPALGLKNSVEHIADLIEKYPKASDMFAKYLHLSLQPMHLGYFERVAESAVQYAERLLKTHTKNLKSEPSKIANDLVYSYKDHGFVIDAFEAREIFGDKIIKTNTDEYKLGNSLYNSLMFINNIADVLKNAFYFIGSCDSDPNFVKKRN